MKTDTFVEDNTCVMVLREAVWGNMSVMTMASFHSFTENSTLTHVLYGELDCSHKIDFAVFLCK
jgi:hypothetical protein